MIRSFLKGLASRAGPPSPARHNRLFAARVDRFLQPRRLPASSLILNLGSGSTSFGSHVVNLDIQPSSSVDVIADAHSLPFCEGSFQAVFCQAVLEHVRRPGLVAAEIRRVLRPGGEVLVDVPFTYPYHDQIDFQRFTLDGLKQLFQDFEEPETGISVGPATALIEQARFLLAAMLAFDSKVAFHGWALVFGWLLFPLRYLNLLLESNRFAWRCATGYYLIARKPLQRCTE